MRDRLSALDLLDAPEDWASIRSRSADPHDDKSQRPTRRLLAAAVAIVVAIGGGAVLLNAFNTQEPPGPAVSSTPTPSLIGFPRVTGHVKLPPNTIAGSIAVGAGSVWVEAWPTKGGDSSLLRIDPATNEVVATLPLTPPTKTRFLAATDQAVWVSEGRTVQRIDPNTNGVVATVAVPGDVSAMTATSTDVWVIAINDSSEGSLVRIDQGTNEVLAVVPLGPAFTGYQDQVIAGAGAVWALGVRWNGKDRGSAEYGGDLVRVDPATNQVVARVPVDGFWMAVGDDSVWVKFPSDGVFDSSDEKWLWTTVDTSTDEPSAPFLMDTRGVELVTPDGLWSVDVDDQNHIRVTRFDPKTHEVLARSDAIPSPFEGAVVDPSTGAVWISTFDTVTRVDISGSSGETSQNAGPSPAYIYFRVDSTAGTAQVHAVGPDGTDPHVVFPLGSAPTTGHLVWTADGSRFAFDAYYGNHVGISTADSGGGMVTHLTNAVNDTWPSWSPDGTRIVFASTRYDANVEACPTGIDLRCPTDIYVMNSDGSGVTRLTTDAAPEWDPVWSPDGTQIAFVKGDSETEVFVMQADGSSVRQVTTTEGGSGFAPSWSPDGSQIIFGSIQNENLGIFAVNPDGTNERPLLFDSSISATDPEWSPDGSLIAFTGSLGYSAKEGLYIMHPDGSRIVEVSKGVNELGAGIAWGPKSV